MRNEPAAFNFSGAFPFEANSLSAYKTQDSYFSSTQNTKFQTEPHNYKLAFFFSKKKNILLYLQEP